MANKLTSTDLLATSFVDSTSRYAQSDVFYYGDQNRITFEIYKRVAVPPSANDLFTAVTPQTEYRPDLISIDAFGTPDFWWQIMQVNNIKDIFDFRTGLNLRIPQNIFT